jgi:hypothetical protein
LLNNSQTNNRERKKGIKENRGWAKEARTREQIMRANERNEEKNE